MSIVNSLVASARRRIQKLRNNEGNHVDHYASKLDAAGISEKEKVVPLGLI
jgi:hypothetical protein